MWGHPHSANRMGLFRGSQEERFAPGWNRDYSPSLDSLAQERHSGNFSGRESLPFDIQGLPGILNPQFANREESTFSFGGRDGPRSDFRGGEGHMHDFGSRDYLPSDFQSRDDSQLDFRARVPLLPDFRGRKMYPGNFQKREGQAVEYSGGDVPTMDYRNWDAFRMNYRDREAHTVNYRGRDDTSSDCHARGTSDLDFRNRDGSHPHFRARDMPEQDYRGREQPYSDFRKRDVPDTDLRNVGVADSDFRDRDIPHSYFRTRPKRQADQDFRGRDAPPPLDFAERERPLPDSNVLDFHHSQSTVQLADRECKIEETVVVRDRSSLSIQNEDLPHSKSRESREEKKTQEQNLKTKSSLEFQNSRNPLPNLLDQDKSSQGFVSNQEISAKEDQVAELPGLKEESYLDFLGRQDTDYRDIEYRDVDHRLQGCWVFDYEHSKSVVDGKFCKDSQPDLQDQDYRTCLKDTKPSKLIRLGKVPETATKDDILNAFQACDGTPVKNLCLKDYTTDCHSREKPLVLICGHSMAFWAGRRAAKSDFGTQLKLSRWARVKWLGRNGMQWDGLLPLLFDRNSVKVVPRWLVIHLGGNDLGVKKGLALILQAFQDFQVIKGHWPDTHMVWSDIIPRKVWHCSGDPKGVNKARKRVNKAVSKMVLELGGQVIHHPDIRISKQGLYREDGVSLTDEGNDIFLSDLQTCLQKLVQAGGSQGV